MLQGDTNLQGVAENVRDTPTEWLIGSGEIADRIRSTDWASTPLGARDEWPTSLRTVVNLIVASKMPMVVAWGPQFIAIYNDSCGEIFAERHPGALGRPIPETWPEIWPLVGPNLADIMSRGESFDRKNVRFPALGRGRYEDLYFTLADNPIRSEDGSIGGVLTVLHETTAEVLQSRELERAWEADRATRAMLEAALGSMADGVCIMDTQGQLITYNDAFAKLYSALHVDTQTLTMDKNVQSFDVYLPDGTLLPPEQWGVSHALRGEGVMNAEYMIRRKGTGESWIGLFNHAPLRNAQNAIVGVVVTGRDITERKRAEDALRASEAKYTAIFEKSPFALAITTLPGGKFTAVNDAFLRLFEYTREEVLGKNSEELGMADHEARERARIELERNGFVHDHECVRWTKNRRKRHILLNLDPVEIGGQTKVLVTIQDISARKEAEEARQLYQKTKELDELKTRFFSSISHEFRTPLSLILGPTEHILQHESTPEWTRKNLALIARNARTLLGYVNNLLDVAKVEAGRMIVEYVPTDLAHLVRVAASHFEILAADHRISFEVQAPERLPAEIDAEKVQRIVMNLLSNAFKFTPAGGRVRITVKEIPGRVHIEVADSGPGVPEERREKLFERFGTADPGATGLGLSIVREFTVLHGGTIALTNAPEGGALFVIELPHEIRPEVPAQPKLYEPREIIEEIRPPHSANHAPLPLEQPSTSTKQPLVLVIEDNVDMNAFIVDSIADQYRVRSAFNGREGLEEALKLEPDLILCDLMMPQMTGEELVHEVRQHAALATTPIVVLSAKADDTTRVRLLLDGVQDYLTKPFGVEELRARVGNLVTKRLTERALQLAIRTRDDVLSVVAHDLRNPLGVILIEAAMLDKSYASADARMKRMLDSIDRSARRMGRIIEDLLDVARCKFGQLSLDPERHSLDEIISTAVDSQKSLSSRASLTIQREDTTDLTDVYVDRDRLVQVLENLLGNAIKFSPKGKTIVVGTKQQGNDIVVWVRDQGMGIAPDALPHVFDRFWHGDTRQGGGTGLGLAIVKGIVEAHGGRVWVESTLGTGSTFYFTIPVVRQDEN